MTRALGILHMAISGTLLAGGAALCFALWQSDPADVGLLVLVIYYALAAFIYPIPGFIAGLALVLGKPWGRGLMFALSLVLLLAFPLGTLLGGYSLWVLLTDTPEPPIPLGTESPGLRSNAAYPP